MTIATFDWIDAKLGSIGKPSPLFDVKLLNENDEEVELKESIDYGDTNFNAILNSDKNFSGNKEDSQAFEQAGFQTQEFVNDELQTVDASGEVFSDGEEN